MFPGSEKEQILATIEDDVTDFLYYDRKEDHLLPKGVIEAAVEMGRITVDEMVDAYRKALEKGLK